MHLCTRGTPVCAPQIHHAALQLRRVRLQRSRTCESMRVYATAHVTILYAWSISMVRRGQLWRSWVVGGVLASLGTRDTLLCSRDTFLESAIQHAVSTAVRMHGIQVWTHARQYSPQ